MLEYGAPSTITLGGTDGMKKWHEKTISLFNVAGLLISVGQLDFDGKLPLTSPYGLEAL